MSGNQLGKNPHARLLKVPRRGLEAGDVFQPHASGDLHSRRPTQANTVDEDAWPSQVASEQDMGSLQGRRPAAHTEQYILKRSGSVASLRPLEELRHEETGSRPGASKLSKMHKPCKLDKIPQWTAWHLKH